MASSSVIHHHERSGAAPPWLPQLLDAVAVGLLHTRPDGIVQYANPRAAAMLGRQPAELVGLHLLELIHAEDGAGLQACIEQLLQGLAECIQRDSRWLRTGGGVAHLSLHLSCTLGPAEDGAPSRPVTGLALVLDDISERVHMAEALGTARQAEQASRAKTEFLSRMSHELRTPLNAMLGFAQLLRVDPHHPLSEAQQLKVEHIEQAGAHLLAMMNDVLDLSRIEAGSLPMSLQSVPVAHVVDDAIALVQHQAAQARLQLSGHVAEAIVVHPALSAPALMVRADPVRLRQVLVNLLTNAIKYNRPGGRVMIEAMPIDGEVMFNVTDSGPGLTPQQQAHLFEPFNRLGAERTGIEGTGIGLVIVKRLTELMHGRIEVSSAPGTGSSFKVWLSQASTASLQPASGPTDTHVRHLQADDSAVLAAPRRTVLYAEDNLINIELVRQIMRMRPHWHLEVAVSGQQAIEMARQSPPDLLLLDMHLGDMSGLDVADALAVPPTVGVPRVALSADAMPDQINEARARGFVDYLTKPLDVAHFLALLDQVSFPPLDTPPTAS